MGVLDTLERILVGSPSPKAAQLHTDPTYPLSGDSPELRALLAGQFNVAGDGLSTVGEEQAFSIAAFSRGCELISGTIAGMPFKTYRKAEPRQAVPSIFDTPQGPFAINTHDWMAMVVLHLVAFREAYLDHVSNVGGGLVGFWPIHPGAVTKVEWVGTQKRYTVQVGSQALLYGTPDAPIEGRVITQILGPGIVSGLRGVPLWVSHRKLFQIALAAEKATGKVFTGPLLRGLITTADEEDIDGEEAALIMEQLNGKFAGAESANQFQFVNRHLKFDHWQQTNADAQFDETRTNQNEEFARLLGLPPHLLAMVDKQTSWGTGVAEQNLGLARYTLMDYTSRIEAATLPLNPPGEFQEFDYKGLLQGSPSQEIELLLKEVAGGILTADEARAVMNLKPLPKVETQNADQAVQA